MSGATVAVQAIRDILYFAGARGVDAASLGRDAGIDPRKLEDGKARLAGSSLGRLWELAAERTGDPFFGLHLGEMATAARLGILGYTMLSSRSVGTALDRLVRYGHLYTYGIDFDVIRTGRVLRVECAVVRDMDNYLIESPRHPLECTTAAIRAVLSSLAGRPIPLRSVTLGHADPSFGYAPYEAAFGVRPVFKAIGYAVELDSKIADWPIATADNEMLETMDARADGLLSDLSSGRKVTDAVTRAIGRSLRGEPPRMEDVAKGMAMSPRTLQRALKQEETTYQEVLDHTRHNLAVRYLADSGVVIFEVAMLLGFSEPSAFHRAFKRWTGVTPRQFQQLATAGSALPS
jgi:AraC-like DNA-binding protein